MKILLIDDDPDFRHAAHRFLRSHGHVILEAGRCQDGERLLAMHLVDFVIVDGLLPDGDGLAWVKRQRDAGMKLPVLFVSAFRKTAQEQQRLRQECGLNDFLDKPITAAALLARVERLEKQCRQASSNDHRPA